jgi:hypothetical protein
MRSHFLPGDLVRIDCAESGSGRKIATNITDFKLNASLPGLARFIDYRGWVASWREKSL